MNEFLEKEKRQLEIISLVYLYPLKYKIIDFEIIYNCNSITIKRDLREIRNMGIDIHSVSKKGLVIFNKLDKDKFWEINNKLGYFIERELEIEKANTFLLTDLSSKNFSFLGVLNFSITHKRKIEIIYGETENRKIICPYKLFIRDNTWRLLAEDKKIIKQFRVERIKSIILKEESFKKIPENEVRTLLSTSFLSWVGKDEIKIKIDLGNIKLNRKLSLNQRIINTENGKRIMELEVNNLEEIARWIAGRGDEIIVLEPVELVERVKEISFKTYQNLEE